MCPCPHGTGATQWGSIPEEVMLGAAVRDCNRFVAEAALRYCIAGSVLCLKGLKYIILDRKHIWN